MTFADALQTYRERLKGDHSLRRILMGSRFSAELLASEQALHWE